MGDNADNKPNMSLGTIIKLKAKGNNLTCTFTDYSLTSFFHGSQLIV